ncbi:hypothetical protein PSP6_370081 [Paraburkholderia tropica]|nr:hypothetical protein PSP6_370081 [Paraburkholderia tropica]
MHHVRRRQIAHFAKYIFSDRTEISLSQWPAGTMKYHKCALVAYAPDVPAASVTVLSVDPQKMHGGTDEYFGDIDKLSRAIFCSTKAHPVWLGI